MPFHMSEKTEQHKHHWNLSFLNKCYSRSMMVRLNFIKGAMHQLTYCIFARIVLFISGTILSSRQFFWRRDVSPLKANAMEKKWEWGLTSLKDALHLSTHHSFLTRMLLLIQGNMRQIAAYKQHVPSTAIFLVSRNAAMCIGHCTFWRQYWMSITHCMLCRNLMFWKTYCMIEGKLNITMKGRKAAFLQKGTLHV